MARPTIIIAYGEYGFHILHSLLSNSSERGLLNWNRSKKIDGKKTLHNLELIWLTKKDNRNADKNLKIETKLRSLDDPIYRDLYQQIKPVSLIGSDISPLKKCLNTAQERLLSPSQLIQEKFQATPGLDVFFLASLYEDNESLPALDAIMYPLIEHINDNNYHFSNQYQSAPILNFIEILDYERLSSATDDVVSGRYDLKASIDSWQSTRSAQGLSRGFGRVYICDGTSQRNYRSIDLRRKEVVLFLELLLFESIREDENLKHLFECKPDKSILSTFGIRLGEQNIEALSQYAAASFAQGWISYLSSNELYEGVISSVDIKTKNVISTINVKQITERVRMEDDIKETIDIELSKAKKDLADNSKLSVDNILEKLEVSFINAESKAAQKISALLVDIRKEELSKFKNELMNAVSHDLNDSRYPVPLGKLISLIDNQISEIENLQKDNTAKASNSDSFLNMPYMRKTIKKYYGWYNKFIGQRIHENKLKHVWIGFSFVLSMLLTPSFIFALQYLFRPQSNAYVISQIFTNNPLFLFLAIMFLSSIILSIRGHQFIRKKLKSANDWFINLIRGRLIHALNAVSRNDKLFGKLYDDVYHSLYSEIQQSLYEVKELLEKRKEEMSWLVTNLGIYKTTFNFSDTNSNTSEWDAGNIRYEIRESGDLIKIQERLPIEANKFADKIEGAPDCFSDWKDRYNSVFLSPLYFIEELSKLYSKPFYEEILQNVQEKNSTSIIRYLNNQSKSFSVGLDFPEQDGLHDSMKYALLSSEFSKIAKVDSQILNHFGIDSNHLIELENPLRIYLLTVKLGIDKKILEQVRYE